MSAAIVYLDSPSARAHARQELRDAAGEVPTRGEHALVVQLSAKADDEARRLYREIVRLCARAMGPGPVASVPRPQVIDLTAYRVRRARRAGCAP
jgi:hypothetical protein